jgi:hypothetical protein
LEIIIMLCGTWLLTLREERGLWMFKNRMPRKIGPKREEVEGDEKNQMRSLLICTPNQILFG